MTGKYNIYIFGKWGKCVLSRTKGKFAEIVHPSRDLKRYKDSYISDSMNAYDLDFFIALNVYPVVNVLHTTLGYISCTVSFSRDERIQIMHNCATTILKQTIILIIVRLDVTWKHE